MNGLFKLVCVGISTAMLLMSGTASAHTGTSPSGPSSGSSGSSGSGGSLGSPRDISVANYADLSAQGDDAKASANCQFLMAINTVILNLVVAESLGLTDGAVIAGSLGGSGAPSLQSDPEGPRRDGDNESERTATATCEQAFGTIRIVNNPSIGWGEVAPHGRTLDEVFKAVRGGRNATSVAAGAGASVTGGSAAVLNRVDMDLRGNGTHALANCQFVVAANTFVLDAAFASANGQTASGSSDGSGGQPASQRGDGNATESERTATSSCVQRVTHFELLLGERTVLVPES